MRESREQQLDIQDAVVVMEKLFELPRTSEESYEEAILFGGFHRSLLSISHG